MNRPKTTSKKVHGSFKHQRVCVSLTRRADRELSFRSCAITYPATLRQVAEAEAGRAMNGGGVAPAWRLTARCFQAPHRRRDGATPPRRGDNYRQLSTSFYANLYSP